VTVLAINGSISAGGKTRAVAAEAVAQVGGEVLDLADLDAEALLGRKKDDAFDRAVEQVSSATQLVLVTPVYRATYSGVLKAFFDLLPQAALRGSVSLLAATGASPAHYLSLDTGLRTLVASLEGWSAPSVVYALSADFEPDGTPAAALKQKIANALAELGHVIHPDHETHPVL
jgi:FMN reductase